MRPEHNLTVVEIQARAEAINLSLKRLAQRAGISPATAYRMLDGGGLLVSHQRLVETLTAEENRLRRYLSNGSHGVPPPE